LALPPAVVVVAVVAQAPVPAVLALVTADPVVLAERPDPVVLAERPVLARMADLADLVVLAERPDPVVLAEVFSLAPETGSWAPLHLRGLRSFSAAMARIFTSPEKPTYERVPRSR
jgi:hypothetical protein